MKTKEGWSKALKEGILPRKPTDFTAKIEKNPSQAGETLVDSPLPNNQLKR